MLVYISILCYLDLFSWFTCQNSDDGVTIGHRNEIHVNLYEIASLYGVILRDSLSHKGK